MYSAVLHTWRWEPQREVPSYDPKVNSLAWLHLAAGIKNGDNMRREVRMYVCRFAWCIAKPPVCRWITLPSNALCLRCASRRCRSPRCSWSVPTGLACSRVEIISPSAGGVRTLLPAHWQHTSLLLLLVMLLPIVLPVLAQLHILLSLSLLLLLLLRLLL